MRFAMATLVALLIFQTVDEHLCDGQDTRAATAMLIQIASSFG
jgi:hypothetical protein